MQYFYEWSCADPATFDHPALLKAETGGKLTYFPFHPALRPAVDSVLLFSYAPEQAVGKDTKLGG